MSRRLEIELTSRRSDGTWTWRAAGARQPKGEVAGELLPESASVGSVLRAEADGGLDGLEIISVVAPRQRSEAEGRLELIGGGAGPPVTTTLVSKRRRHDDDRHGDDDRGDHRGRRGQRDGQDRRPRRRDGKRDDARPRDGREGDDRERRDRRPQRGSRDDRSPRGRDGGRPDDRGRRDDGGRRDDRGRRDDGGRRPRRDSRSRSGDGPDGKRGDRRSSDQRPQKPPRPKAPALKAKQVHRRAALAALPDEQQPLAREVLRGGVPGVRKNIERMNKMAAAEKLPQVKSDPLVALAENLVPALKAAEWHDRADAALAGIETIDLRDIRSVIAAADRAARTDETRALAENLRSGLTTRLEVDHRKWLDELAATIHEGRTVRALRLSSRPPKAGAPLPPDMAERLANMAAADLDAATSSQRWSTVVDAVAFSPVRTQVVPAGVPENPTEDLLAAMGKLADRVPQIASILGIEAQPQRRGRRRPPPPPPVTETAAAADAPARPEADATTDDTTPSKTAAAADAPARPEADATTDDTTPSETADETATPPPEDTPDETATPPPEDTPDDTATPPPEDTPDDTATTDDTTPSEAADETATPPPEDTPDETGPQEQPAAPSEAAGEIASEASAPSEAAAGTATPADTAPTASESSEEGTADEQADIQEAGAGDALSAAVDGAVPEPAGAGAGTDDQKDGDT